MKKTIYTILAASLLLTGCTEGNSITADSETASTAAVTAAVSSAITAEKATDKTEAVTTEAELPVINNEEQPQETDTDTSQQEKQDNIDTQTAETAELTEENAASEPDSARANPDGSIDLPIIPVD